MTRYLRPFHQEDEEVLTADGEHFAFADSIEAAAEIVNLANTSWRASEQARRHADAVEGRYRRAEKAGGIL